MADRVSELMAWAKQTAYSGDPRILGEFRSRLTQHLDIKQPCAEPLFEEVLNLLRSAKLASYSEFGNLLTDLAIADFAFTAGQIKSLIATVEDTYFTIQQPIARMQACHLFIAFQSHEAAAKQFLRLLQKTEEQNAPHAELIWELAALVADESVSLQTRRCIEQVLPRKG